jgi:hypothetical protein
VLGFGQIDPTQQQRKLFVTHDDLALRITTKSACTSIRRPPGSTTASPQPGSCCDGDFLAANSTGTKRPSEEIGFGLLFQRSLFRWQSRVLKLKPRLWQNSLRRIPLLTNSATNC